VTEVADQDDVRRLALALPEVTECEPDFGFAVAGKTFLWLWRERVDPRKPKVPNADVVVVRVADLAEKAALIASHPACFTEPHYDGYKAVLVRLPDADPALLDEVVADSWRAVAPKRLVSRLD
jgi:hypothetical protein